MHFLYIKIVDIDYKENVYLALESVGINKASYIEGLNLDTELTSELALFTGFFKGDEEKSKQVGIINALVESEEEIDEFLSLLEESGVDIYDETIIRVLSWDVKFRTKKH